MNEHLRKHTLGLTTRSAEGLPRRRWTTVELERMVAAGILDPDERFELIGGEVVPMSPKGRRHEIVRDFMTEYFSANAPRMFGSTPNRSSTCPMTSTRSPISSSGQRISWCPTCAGQRCCWSSRWLKPAYPST